MGIQDLAGQTLGQYELRELLGAGGMGAVYRGYQPSLSRAVAIKVLSPVLAEQTGYIARFNREAKVSAALEHPHIVHVYDYGTQREISYLVMQLLTGGSLSERIARRAETPQPLPSLGEVSTVLAQLASALDYAHSQGVIHRDIKPSNVMFDNQGNAYLVDFGIAKLLEATSGLTESGMVIGTWGYMAPEQWRAEDPVPATDQYALGVMTYSLVTGRMPFEAPTPAGIMHKHLNEKPTPPQTLRPELSQAMMLVIDRALAKKPLERFPTCTAFAQSFDRAISGSAGESTAYFIGSIPREPRKLLPPPTTPADSIVLTGGPSEAVRQPFYRSRMAWSMLAVIVLLMAALFYILLGREEGGKKSTPGGAQAVATTVPTTAPAIVVLPSDTPDTPALTGTLAVPSPTPTLPTDTSVPSNTSLPLIQPETQVWLDLSATAAQWTATPSPSPTNTPDYAATYDIQMTQAVQTITAAAWTDTPTITPLPTETPLPTWTWTPTWTPLPTLTHTPVPIPTSTRVPPTRTPAPTATRTPIPPTQPATPTPLPVLPTEIPARSLNALVWPQPVTQVLNGMELVYVPAGCFFMGSGGGDSDELPEHRVCLSSFWISRTEVTNSQYKSCVGLGFCTPPPNRQYFDDPAYANYPVADVTWDQATQFAGWAGGGLPSEAQWEYAARGPESRLYPWGNTFNGALANTCDASCGRNWQDSSFNDGYGGLAPVTSYPNASWVGAFDMAGNAWEWVADWYGETYYGTCSDGIRDPAGPSSGELRVLRGGSWFNIARGVRSSYRGWIDPEYLPFSLGFRIVLMP